MEEPHLHPGAHLTGGPASTTSVVTTPRGAPLRRRAPDPGRYAPPVRRAAVAVVLTGILTSGLAAALGGGAPPAAWERGVARLAVDLPFTPALWTVMQVGNRLVAAVVVVLVLVAGHRRPAAALALGATAAWAAAEVLQSLVGRDRPTAGTLGRPVREVVIGPGFPSSHTAVAAAVATVLALACVAAVTRSGRRRAAVTVGFCTATLTAVARVHVGAHWPLDVLAGLGVGVAAGAVALRAVPVRTSGTGGGTSTATPADTAHAADTADTAGAAAW